MSSNMNMNSDIISEEGRFLGKNHKVIKFLWAGCFAYVYKCLNTKTNKMEAIKITMSDPDSISLAMQQISILKHLRRLDPDKCNIIKYYGSFYHKKHICLRFELLDQTLKAYMKEKHKSRLPMPELRPVIRQLATAVSHLSSFRIIHADIKLKNVMIVDRLQTPIRVRLIDFGMAHAARAPDPDRLTPVIMLKSPEALFGCPYNEAVDMWSLGLVASKLATGVKLYFMINLYDMVSDMIELQGQPSDKVLDCGTDTHLFFKREVNSARRWRFKTKEEYDTQVDGSGSGSGSNDYDDYVSKTLDDLPERMCEDRKRQRAQRLLVDLIKRMLHLDQDQRIKPKEVLQHPFFLPGPSETTRCLAAESKEDTGDVWPDTRAQNGGVLRRLFRRIWQTVLCWS